MYPSVLTDSKFFFYVLTANLAHHYFREGLHELHGIGGFVPRDPFPDKGDESLWAGLPVWEELGVFHGNV